MNFLKSLLAMPWVQHWINNQVNSLAAGGAAFITSHAAGAGYSQAAINGSLACLGAIAVQAAESKIRSMAPPKPQPQGTQA